MGTLLKEYLDVPEQPPVASDVSRISCAGNDDLINDTIDVATFTSFFK